MESTQIRKTLQSAGAGVRAGARTLNVRDSLALLVLGCVLPISGVAAFLVFDYYDREQMRLTSDAVHRVHARLAAVDHEFSSIEAALLALATSTRLAPGDFGDFRVRATSVLKNMNADAILLTDATGRVLSSTSSSDDVVTLPQEPLARTVRHMFETARPEVSALLSAPSMPAIVFAVGVPVLSEGTVTGSLHAIIRAQKMAHLLDDQRLSGSWLAAILDSTSAIVARSQDSDKYVGKRPNPEFVRRFLESDRGEFVDKSLGGGDVSIVYERSPLSRWGVAVEIPLDVLTSDMRRWVSLLIAACFVALLLGLLLAWFIGGRIARSIGALAAPARQLGAGGAIDIPTLHLREAVELGTALLEAGVTLTKARHEAHHDSLTGLANRVLLNIFIQQQLTVCRRYQRELSILAIDLDGFKAINDTHGHALGDQLLREVSARIRRSTRVSDIAARLGGDEFALCLLDTGMSGAQTTAQKLIAILAQPYIVGELQVRISASVGVASFPSTASDIDTLMSNADRAMYEAKSLGKNQVRAAPA